MLGNIYTCQNEKVEEKNEEVVNKTLSQILEMYIIQKISVQTKA